MPITIGFVSFFLSLKSTFPSDGGEAVAIFLHLCSVLQVPLLSVDKINRTPTIDGNATERTFSGPNINFY